MAVLLEHPVSLVDRSIHSHALMALVNADAGGPLLGELKIKQVFWFQRKLTGDRLPEHVVDLVIDIVDRGTMEHPHLHHSAITPQHLSLLRFMLNVIQRARVKVPTLLVTVVYLMRIPSGVRVILKPRVYEEVFLGALISAHKVCFPP